ncbi:hypothetical protein EXIGLDRAFT_716115 [Exidia glandulosa HHB12029]|uniref:Uncharacterized protein n=1 Tax=Exidia glandulosa HHB12029 TaxID=1314781 RepID=A0A166BUB9_EXIGL|nr:hypothetical protein EXIGLDRAFT_716115 [Exidia glandulosa HHB12029]
MDTTSNLPHAQSDDPLTEAADTLASLIEHYERQQNWIQRVQESVQRVQQHNSRTPSPHSSSTSSSAQGAPPSKVVVPRPHLTANDPRQRSPMHPAPGLNVANLLQIYGSIVSERVESCKRTAELIREADRLSLEKFECVVAAVPCLRA